MGIAGIETVCNAAESAMESAMEKATTKAAKRVPMDGLGETVSDQGEAGGLVDCRGLRARPTSSRSNQTLGSKRSSLAATPICHGMTR